MDQTTSMIRWTAAGHQLKVLSVLLPLLPSAVSGAYQTGILRGKGTIVLINMTTESLPEFLSEELGPIDYGITRPAVSRLERLVEKACRLGSYSSSMELITRILKEAQNSTN